MGGGVEGLHTGEIEMVTGQGMDSKDEDLCFKRHKVCDSVVKKTEESAPLSSHTVNHGSGRPCTCVFLCASACTCACIYSTRIICVCA